MQPENFGNSLVLFEKLASGGMGEVFKAKQIGSEGFEKTVAVKRILPHFTAQQDISQLFKQEMWLASKLQHSNVAQVFSNGIFADYLYLVMEYVHGKTLAEIISLCTLRDELLGVDHCCYIISEAAKGLHYAHSLRDEETGAPLNVVHRDVTPQNIMCSENGEVKVLDFGIARVLDNISDFSRMGDVKGKIQYVAPEQLAGQRASPQSDVFSLGVTMVELLTRRPLFLEESPYQTMNSVLTKQIPPLAEFRQDVPGELEEILIHALERDPSKRFRTAEEFHRRLSAFLGSNYPEYSSTELGRTVHRLSARDHVASSSYPAILNASSLSAIITRTFTPTLNRTRSEFFVRPVRILISVLLGLVLAIAYLWSGQDRRTPSMAPIASFVADDIRPDPDGRITEWVGSAPGGAMFDGSLAFEQRIASRRPLFVRQGVAGHATVRFEGAQYLISTSIAQRLTSASTATFIVIAKMQPDHIGYLFAIQQADKEFDVLRLGSDDSSHIRVKTVENAAIRLFHASETRYPPEFSIFTLSVENNIIHAYLNGHEVLPSGIPEPVAFKKSTVMSLGQEFDSPEAPSDFLQGEIAEVMIFDSALVGFYRSIIEENIAAKYGIQLRR